MKHAGSTLPAVAERDHTGESRMSEVKDRRSSFLTKVQPLLDAIATVSVIGVSGVVGWNAAHGARVTPAPPTTQNVRRADPVPPREPISLAGANVEGDRRAKVALIEYSDFQCPFCGAFARETLPEVRKRFVEPGKVLFAFKHLP